MQLYHLVKLASMSRDIFQFFIYDEEKRKMENCALIIYHFHWPASCGISELAEFERTNGIN